MAHQQKPVKLELLAPARDIAVGRDAVIHGADAVYIGAEAFGARAAAGNSVADIASLVEFAHFFEAKVYVTLNTLLYDSELKDAENLIRRLYRAGVDALIVQDLSVLRMDIPPIALHASTQCDTRTPDKARFLQDCGFSQIVLARELSLDEIRAVASAVTVPIEVFVHGALCVSYSGDCQASLFATGRSANRGECAQMCRLPYSLTDERGKRVAPDAHYLSLRDMNRLDRLADLVDVGVTSFKIEGRLKENDYVRNTVAAYSLALDGIVARSGGRFMRESAGTVELSFQPDVTRTFNRRFTTYFLDGRPTSGEKLASTDSPKWIGVPVTTVESVKGRAVKVKNSVELNNGDGLGYFDGEGRYCGFRANKVEGNIVWAASDVFVSRGTKLYRNRDKRRDDEMASVTARRTVSVDAVLRTVTDYGIALRLTDERGHSIEMSTPCELQPARTSQLAQRRRAVDRFGDTVFRLREYSDSIPDNCFVPASVLAELRRAAVSALVQTRAAVYSYDYRKPESETLHMFRSGALNRHDNVANRLSRDFYIEHGFTVDEPAAEIALPDSTSDRRVMTTRYCLRRELGACLRTKDGSRLPSPLFLRSQGVTYRLDFDCRQCCMHVMLPAE